MSFFQREEINARIVELEKISWQIERMFCDDQIRHFSFTELNKIPKKIKELREKYIVSFVITFSKTISQK